MADTTQQKLSDGAALLDAVFTGRAPLAGLRVPERRRAGRRAVAAAGGAW